MMATTSYQVPTTAMLNKVWEVSTGRCVNTLKGHADGISEAHFSRDGQWIASSDNRDLRVWEAATGKCMHILEVHDGLINRTAFSSDSRHLAVACKIGLHPLLSHDIQVWDVVQGMLIQTLQVARDEVDHDALVFSEDGRYSAASSSRVTHIWDTTTFPYEMAQKLKHDFFHGQPAFLNNSRYLATFAGESVLIWDINQGQPIHTIDTTVLDMRPLSFDMRCLSFDMRCLSFDMRCLSIDMRCLSIDMRCLSIDMRCLSFDENNFRVAEHGKDALPFEELLWPGYGLSRDLEWILRDGEKAIWLPLEYRVGCYRVLGRTIALGCFGGHVLFLTLSESC
ncbi:WD40-repeat-containing domain protein [Phialemonium atrogriseum]|uniref:WD40-repeat-containing domain protein n=1 Tax=Phialemonium atrogriseum TaxID=1093897 RepID=A0AAJ0C3A8_9PEZI|nr:WD40-repeat-containing domain protein [Phialemonium atrogriseum]KAK1767917.1 WD40-repeat-containing domain protein [Phialemonium atrogriseum]